MAGIFGRTNATKATEYSQIQLQTSAEGVCIPIVWGRTRVAPNLIWSDNFKKHGGGGKKGGGGKGGATGKGGSQTTYSAGIMLALCEGPIQDVPLVYKDNYTTSLAALGLTLYTGTATQTPWSAVSTNPDYVPLAYPNTAYVVSNNYDLGAAATLPQHNFEVYGFRQGEVPGRVDVDPADIVYDLLTSTQYGLGMPTDAVGDRTAFSNFCRANTILFSPALTTQEQAISILQRWAQLTNTWIFWSGGQLKFVPLGDAAATDNGVTYTPNLSPVYALTWEDFQTNGSEPPITVTRSDPADAYNWVKLEINDRGKNYNAATIEYKDQTSIDRVGLTQAQDVQASEICDRVIGSTVAGIIGQRAVNVRNTYQFKLSYNFVLLEPGDLVTLTDPAIGLDGFPVRIRTVAEDEQGTLTFEAEECPAGIATPTFAAPQTWAGISAPAHDVDPGDVNAPAMFEPPASVTQGIAQIWIGLSGGPYWGGAEVWVSLDDVTYIQLGTITQPSPQGVLLRDLASHADPDTADTLAVDLTMSEQLLSAAVTHADADAGRAVALVGNELIGYGAVAPDPASSFAFDLTYLRRGFYNTPIGAHPAGTLFTALVPALMLAVDLPQAYVGQTLYLKFPSFNLYGAGLQDISTVTRYTYVPTGVVYTIAPPTSPALAITTPSGATAIAMTLSWAASPGPNLGSYEAQFSADGGVSWTAADVTLGASATGYTFTPAIPNANYQARVRAISAGGQATSDWATSAVVNSGAAPPFGGGTIEIPLVNGDVSPVGIITDPAGVPVYVVQ